MMIIKQDIAGRTFRDTAYKFTPEVLKNDILDVLPDCFKVTVVRKTAFENRRFYELVFHSDPIVAKNKHSNAHMYIDVFFRVSADNRKNSYPKDVASVEIRGEDVEGSETRRTRLRGWWTNHERLGRFRGNREEGRCEMQEMGLSQYSQ